MMVTGYRINTDLIGRIILHQKKLLTLNNPTPNSRQDYLKLALRPLRVGDGTLAEGDPGCVLREGDGGGGCF